MSEVSILDFLFDEILFRIRAHKQIIFGNYDTRKGGRICRHLFHPDTIGNVDPAVANENPIRSDMSFSLRKPYIDFSGYGWCIRQSNRLQKQFRHVLNFYPVSDTQSGDGLIEGSNTVRARRGDHSGTGVDGLFDPNISNTSFSITVLPWPAAAAATTEAPLPVILHFNQGNARYGCKDSPGRLILEECLPR